MSYLAAAKKPQAEPPMITIVGSPGTGKTTLGAMFPKPIFIQAEDGASVFENWEEDKQPTLLPPLPRASKDDAGNLKVSTRKVLTDQVKELLTAEHDFKTLVVDSISALNILFEQEIAIRDGVGNVADAAGGYHKGYIEVANWHSEFLYQCSFLRRRKGMAIVFLSHTGIEKVKNRPEEASEYATYSLNMNRKSADLYVANCDAIAYLKKDELVLGGETDKKGRTTKFGRVMQTGDRKLITTGDGLTGYVSAKNRYNMPAELDVEIGTNPLVQYIKFFTQEQ